MTAAGTGGAPGAAIDLVLFDLGGVLIRFGGVSGLQALTGEADAATIWVRWLACPWVRRFETGSCSAEEFAFGLVEEWELPLRPIEFLDQFRQWPSGPFDGAEELVAEVALRVPVGCLSNTNRLHWDHLVSWPLTGRFDPCFLSYEMGVLKPDRAAFEYVATRLAPPPERVLFLDDNLVNVEAARDCGFLAAHVDGVAGARRALGAAGVV